MEKNWEDLLIKEYEKGQEHGQEVGYENARDDYEKEIEECKEKIEKLETDIDDHKYEFDELKEKTAELQDVDYEGEKLIWVQSRNAFIGKISRRCYRLVLDESLIVPPPDGFKMPEKTR